MDLDLDRLQERLDHPESSSLLDELLAFFAAHEGRYCWQTISDTPWQTLCIDASQKTERHKETLDRLEGHREIYSHPAAASHFRRASKSEPDLYKVVTSLRRSVTGLSDGLRRTTVCAKGGKTGLTSVFPEWHKLKRIIKISEGLRRHSPLADPLWNILLLRIVLLRAHLFGRGNGRAMRALLSYELHRHGISGPHYFPVVKVFDANRPAIIEANIDISRARNQADLVDSIARSMQLSLRLMLICAKILDRGNRSVFA